MTNLYFVRHAHSIYTPDEMERPLSEKGFNDAKRITDLFKNQNVDVVLSSPYKRAIQTVEGIADYFNKEIEYVEDFKERILTTGPAEDFNHAITKVWEDENFHWEGGETNRFAQDRGVKATLDVIEKYPNKNIVIGTHGNLMVLIMNYFDRKYDFTFWKSLDMPDVYKLTFEGNGLIKAERLWNRELLSSAGR